MLVLLTPARRVCAHAHIFIDYTVQAVFEEETLKGVRASWTFDRMFSAFIIKQFDKDKNGRLSKKESDQVFHQSFQNLKSKHYFTYVRVNGEKRPTPRIREFRARIVGNSDVVRYTFFLPLSVHATPENTSVSVFFFDPVIYVSFTVTKKDVGVSVSSSRINASARITRVKFTNRPTIVFNVN
jgi:ABC-type uncharacterized transport system substrate-binding protein